jgi:hypothetical protein
MQHKDKRHVKPLGKAIAPGLESSSSRDAIPGPQNTQNNGHRLLVPPCEGVCVAKECKKSR